MTKVVIVQTSFAPMNLLRDLSDRINCPVVECQPLEKLTEYSHALMINDNGILQIQPTGKKQSGAVFADFVHGACDHRRKYGGGKGQAIAKAVGLQSIKKPPTVLDCTAGLGRDAFVLAALGCQVTLLERSPIVFALLEDGLRRGMESSKIRPFVQNMHLIQTSATDYFSSLAPNTKKHDIVYLDPMFPHKQKSAEVKKEMQCLQSLLADDSDEEDLLPLALAHACYRVVVKRPRTAQDLNNTQPYYRLEGKRNRFDVYVNQSLKFMVCSDDAKT